MSWYQLLLWDMAQRKYLRLGNRPVTEYNWVVLWALVQEMEQARVSDGQ